MKRQRHHPLTTLIITQISLSKNLFILAKVQRRWITAKFSTDYLENQRFNCIFAATDSATLPIEQRTRAELLRYIGLWNTRNRNSSHFGGFNTNGKMN